MDILEDLTRQDSREPFISDEETPTEDQALDTERSVPDEAFLPF